MIIIERFKNLMEKARGMSRSAINSWRYTLFFLVCADIFGVYWYLHLKKLGIALLIIILLFLGFILFLESKLPEEPKEIVKPNNKTREKEVRKMPNTEEVPEVEEDQGFNLGLPDSEELNKRMEDAFTFKGW